jgi:hypothetical protein
MPAPKPSSPTGSELFIVDNSDEEWNKNGKKRGQKNGVKKRKKRGQRTIFHGRAKGIVNYFVA